MNTRIFKQVEELALGLVAAAEKDDEVLFKGLYGQLDQLCNHLEGSKNDHPVLWETLADFTEENPQALVLYRKAYLLADSLKDNEYKASIQFSLGQRLSEDGAHQEALEALSLSEKFAAFTEDDLLKQDIQELIAELKTEI